MRLTDPTFRFKEALGALPQPGGNGYHPRLLGVANIGMSCGLTPAEVAAAIREYTPQGGRRVPDREIAEAVAKAGDERRAAPRRGPGSRPRLRPQARQARPVFDADGFMADRLAEADGIGEADIWEASPIRIDTAPEQDAALLIEALYQPEDFLFMGDTYGRTVKTAGDWRADFLTGRQLPPHIIPNPLTGGTGLTKAGRPSVRADACVKSFRFAVAEFDDMSRDDQLRFWWAIKLPICALIDSGGKSLHAWIRIDGVETADTWTDSVEKELFGRFLVPLGCDPACRNEARLSRLPGHFRTEKERWQRLLYLAPEGRPIHAGA